VPRQVVKIQANVVGKMFGKIIHMLEAVLVRLSAIPGLGFLYDYLHELETQQIRRRQMVDTYKGYGQSLREAGKAAKHGGHGHGHGEEGEHEKHKGHGKPVKRGKSARPAARPGTGGQVARSSEGKEGDPSDLEENYYEDDDFESYLQH
jgi:hypothetical protein